MEKEKQVLLTWDGNWADEMDISGFAIVSESRWLKHKSDLENKTNRFYFYVGTNEEIEYSNGKELLREIEVKYVTEDEAKVVNKLFGGEFGFTHFLEIDEDDEEDED